MTVKVKDNSGSHEAVTLFYKSELKHMNKSELIHLCRLMGVRAHRGTRKSEMINILLNGEVDRKIDNSFDVLRKKIMKFTKRMRRKGKLMGQTKLGCEGNCFEHTDMQVMLCWITNGRTIEQYSKEVING